MPDADPATARSDALFALFSTYLRFYFWRHFHAVRASRTGLPAAPPGRPLIIYSNHPSWWDPALYILLQSRLFPHHRGYGPMDAEALAKYPLLARMGVFGIALDTPRGAARFLRTSLSVLSNPANILWITAEGAFTDPRLRPLHLRPGLAHLARHIPNATILPLAIEYTFWNESRPEALIRFGPPIDTTRDRSVPEWTALLEHSLTQTLDALAEESTARNPGLFTPLLRGGAGIGGVYDLSRRVHAWRTGHRFDPTHGGPE